MGENESITHVSASPTKLRPANKSWTRTRQAGLHLLHEDQVIGGLYLAGSVSITAVPAAVSMGAGQRQQPCQQGSSAVDAGTPQGCSAARHPAQLTAPEAGSWPAAPSHTGHHVAAQAAGRPVLGWWRRRRPGAPPRRRCRRSPPTRGRADCCAPVWPTARRGDHYMAGRCGRWGAGLQLAPPKWNTW